MYFIITIKSLLFLNHFIEIQNENMMKSGYSGTPLVKKLGIKPGFKILLVYQPEYYYNILEGLPEDVENIEYESSQIADFIHLFVKESKTLLHELPKLKNRMAINGMLWISWPKKSSKVPTEVDETVVRKSGLNTGLVDIKICAIDEIWSGLKFVYRVKDRQVGR